MKIAVIGAGHMGSWLLDVLKDGHELAILDRNKEKTSSITDALVLEGYTDLSDFKPEMLINAVSLQNTLSAFESALPQIPAHCQIVDMASVKGKIPEFYSRNDFQFTSVHPMFGPTFANVNRLSEENVIIIRESNEAGAAFFRELFGSMGVHIFEYSFEEHDRMIAYSLTLPFASTMVFAACMDNTAVPGTTFKRHREIAKGLLSEDDFLLSEILFNPQSLSQLEQVTHRLDFLKHVIRDRDFEECRRFLSQLRENIE